MIIIITNTFEKNYKKYFKKSSNCSIIKICSIINKEALLNGIYLNRPFMKLKFNFCEKAIRLLVINKQNKNIVIPIFITDKNDKEYGYNMTWENIEIKTRQIIIKIYNDIENKMFEEF
ncbi:MAG: hypothetical protein Q9M94_00560 [Candidatus Gracilibacteria bacterium]|nr:hypothetical protein [Candidatus Gracilibacteria bacterium]MDQ7021986.1 hypothetical protein [Candidatus Gracilibacteria bacterium]